MDNENTKIKDTGSWSPFYYWIVGVVTMCALMWMLPNNYPREPWENIIRVLLGALFILFQQYAIGRQKIIFVLPWRY